jgi:hypothetical protein
MGRGSSRALLYRNFFILVVFGTRAYAFDVRVRDRYVTFRTDEAFSRVNSGSALSLSRLSTFAGPLRQERFGFIQFGTPLGAEIVTGAVDVKRQHAHPGTRAFGGDFLRG